MMGYFVSYDSNLGIYIILLV